MLQIKGQWVFNAHYINYGLFNFYQLYLTEDPGGPVSPVPPLLPGAPLGPCCPRDPGDPCTTLQAALITGVYLCLGAHAQARYTVVCV